MIRTIVCQKEGCNGNAFYINNNDDEMSVVCKECNSEYKYKGENSSLLMLSTCSSCSNDAFKVFKDTENNKIYAKCITCGNPPESIFVDADGNQVSYESKLLNNINDMVYRIEQRISNLEIEVENLGSGQILMEQSMAYINQFLSESK